MWTKWTSHLPEPEKEAFRNTVRGSDQVLERQRTILKERLMGLEAAEVDPKAFGSPSWPYLQAMIVGRKAELRDMIKLLTIEDTNDPNQQQQRPVVGA